MDDEIKFKVIESFEVEYPAGLRSFDDLGPTLVPITREQLAEKFPPTLTA